MDFVNSDADTTPATSPKKKNSMDIMSHMSASMPMGTQSMRPSMGFHDNSSSSEEEVNQKETHSSPKKKDSMDIMSHMSASMPMMGTQSMRPSMGFHDSSSSSEEEL